MKKRKDEILVNYEGEPFYNLNTDEWLIDFEPALRNELVELMHYDRGGKEACCLFAVRNMTYNALLGIADMEHEKKYYSVCCHRVSEENNFHPYIIEDMKFLYYRLGQLMTKHQDISISQRKKIVHYTAEFMRFGGIDLINEVGDVFNYPASKIEDEWNTFWWSGQTSYFKINKIFKSSIMRKVAFRTVKKIRWLDDCV